MNIVKGENLIMNEFLSEEIMNNIEYCREIIKLENDDPRKFSVINRTNGYKLGEIDSVPIYFDPIYLRQHDQVMAMACHNGDIVVDEKLLRLSFEGIIWNIYHELGHIKLSHKDLYPYISEYKTERKKCSQLGKVLPIELEADNYCYDIIGHDNFIKGMKDSRVVAEQCNRDVKEMDLRIQNFENK